MKRIRISNILLFLAPVCYLAISVLVVLAVSWSGVYPSGSDTMYHVYRGNFVYESILAGNWWPQLDPMWYNGVELLRYWAPLPAYFMAFCQLLAGGDPLDGYLIFVGLICFLGALPWLYIGFRTARPWLGGVMGALWFFIPNNLLALFVEGNLARSVSMIFLPLFFHSCHSYIERPRTGSLLGATVSFMLISLCHLGYGGMTALGALLYFGAAAVILRRKGVILPLIEGIVVGFLVLGIWIYPSLMGGVAAVDSSEVMAGFFQNLGLTLNPLERYVSAGSYFYFGLSAFVIAVAGIFLSKRETMPDFWAGLILCICTSTSMYPVLRVLPGSQYLWMLRFISIAVVMILYGYLRWDTLRRPLSLLFLAALLIDVVPSLPLIRGTRSGELAEKRLNTAQEETLIKAAKEVTEQRMTLIDMGSMGATGAWLVSAWDKSVPGTFGAGWQAADTGPNISKLERSVQEGNYRYLFDRSRQLGSDTVLLFSGAAEQSGRPVEEIDAAAEAVGYRLMEAGEYSRLYHLDAAGTWGTVSRSRGIALGLGNGTDITKLGICRSFPVLEEADTDNLNDYTFEELSQYEIIYLVGFSYDDRASAEELILRLSEAGVHIVISADGIPEDRKTHNQSFLGVICNKISFSNGYPELNTIDGLLNTDLFPPDHTEWDTVYLEGLDEVWGSVDDGNLLLDFYGTVKNENIVVIGLNLTYFLSLTQDPSVERLLSHAMDLSPLELPEREIVPLEITYGKNTITIVSPEDNVNTSLAYHDIFESDRPISAQNNLTVVDKGTTVITLKYPYLYPGLAVSGLGVLLMLVFLWRTDRRLKWEAIKAAKEERERAEKEGWT